MKQIKENAKTKMEKSINVMLSDFAGIRAGRANPSVLNKVQVEYYGAMTPVTQMAAVSVAEARVLVIQPWDKSTLKPIERLSRHLISALIHRTTALLSDLLSHSSLRTDVRSLLRTSRKWARSARSLSVLSDVTLWKSSRQ